MNRRKVRRRLVRTRSPRLKSWSSYFVLTSGFVQPRETFAALQAASRRVAEKGAAGAALKRTAWEMLTRWERLEPTKHRPPLPETVFEAMCAVRLAWGWDRWVVVATVLGFYGD